MSIVLVATELHIALILCAGTRGECKKRQKEVEAEESSSDNDVVNEKQVVDEKENVNPNTTRKRKRKPVIVNKQVAKL